MSRFGLSEQLAHQWRIRQSFDEELSGILQKRLLLVVGLHSMVSNVLSSGVLVAYTSFQGLVVK